MTTGSLGDPGVLIERRELRHLAAERDLDRRADGEQVRCDGGVSVAASPLSCVVSDGASASLRWSGTYPGLFAVTATEICLATSVGWTT